MHLKNLLNSYCNLVIAEVIIKNGSQLGNQRERNTMTHWQDVKTGSQPDAPLGKVVYRHVHDDGTVHPTRISAPPDRGWVSMVGDKPPVGVLCLGCGLSMREGDHIKVVFEKRKED